MSWAFLPAFFVWNWRANDQFGQREKRIDSAFTDISQSMNLHWKEAPGLKWLEYAWISYSVVLYTYAGPQVLSTIFLTYLNITSSARKRPRDYGDSFKSAHVHIWEPKGHTIFRGSSVTNITTYYWSSEEFSRCLSKGLFILLSNHHPYVSDRETLEEL